MPMLLPNGEQQFFDDNGDPLGLGTVDFYITATTVRKNTWSAIGGGALNLNTNPVLLDAAGRATIFGSGTYRQVLKDSTGATIWDKTVSTFDPSAASDAAFSQSFRGTGSALAFTLSQNFGTSAAALQVYERGNASMASATNNPAYGAMLYLVPTVDYTVNGTTLTLTSAPSSCASSESPNLYVSTPNSQIATILAEVEDAAALISSLSAQITTVAAISAQIITDAAISASIVNVAANSAAVVNVNALSATIIAVNAASATIVAVNANSANINAVNANSANINTVAAISANVTSVAGISAAVTSVNTISATIVAVNANSANINTVGSISANVNTVASISANVNAAVAANFLWTFASSTVMGDPGTGGIRYDNALPSATTNLAISTLTADTGNPNVKAFLLTLDDSSHSPRSTIQLRSASSAGVFTQFGVTGAIVDNGTWLQIPVTPTSSNGAPAASASLYSIFALSGDNGLGAVGSVSAANTTIDVSGTASAVLLARAALTGDVTAAASSNATNIAASAVTSAKIAASAVNSAAISANAVSLDKLATQAANTILTNATSASAVPSALALAASTVLGRDSTGNVSALTLSGLTAVGGVLTASSGPSLAQVHSMVYA